MFGHVCRTRTCGVCAQIALATVPPSSSPAPHPRDSLDCGEGGMLPPGEGEMGGQSHRCHRSPPPGLIYPAEAAVVGIPRFPGGRGWSPGC